MTDKPAPLSEQLRYYLKKEMAKGRSMCEACGRKNRLHSMRQIAREIGCAPATLSRFQHGKSIDSRTIDKLYRRYFV